MQKYADVVMDPRGNVVRGAKVLVKTLAGAKATIYTNAARNPAPNPLTTDSLGRFSFYADNGRYSLDILIGSRLITSLTDILLEDPMDFSPENIQGGEVRDVSLNGVTINGDEPVVAQQLVPFDQRITDLEAETGGPTGLSARVGTLEDKIDGPNGLSSKVTELKQFESDLSDPDKGAAMVARGVVAVDSIADLLALPAGQRREDLRYLVASYHGGWAIYDPYVGPIGGGTFLWSATEVKTNHDGGSVIVPEKAWDGSAEGFLTFLSPYAGEGAGAFIRIPDGGRVTTAMFGATTLFRTVLGTDSLILQNAFDYARTIEASDVIISPSYNDEYVVTAQLQYRVNNSRLLFKSEIRMADNQPEMRGAILSFSCFDTTVENLRINGNRQNNIVSTQRGTQFNFATYQNSARITFKGGLSRNALLCDMQSTSEGIVIDGMTFDTCGEHHLYLTLAPDTPRTRVQVKNCVFKNWGLVESAVAISLRDYRRADIENCEFIPGVSSYGAIQGFAEYDSVIGADEYILVTLTRCKFRRGGAKVYGWQDASMPITVLADQCYFEGFGTPVANNSADGVPIFKVMNSVINWSHVTNRFSRQALPDYCQNVDFLVGASALRLTDGRDKTLLGCRFFNRGVSPDENNLILLSASSGNVTIRGAEFHGFDDFGTWGVIRDDSTKRTVLDGLEFYECGTGRAMRLNNPNLMLTNSTDISGTTTGPSFATAPAVSSGNWFPGASDPTASAIGKAALPDATAFPGRQVYVPDAEGGPTLAFSDGTDWLRSHDHTVVT